MIGRKPYILTMDLRMDDGAYAVDIQLAMEDDIPEAYGDVIAFKFKISYPTDMFTLSSLKLSDDLPAGSSGVPKGKRR